jgi:glutaredoxin
MFMQWQTVCPHCENTQQTLDIKLYAALGIAVTNIGQPVPEDDTI